MPARAVLLLIVLGACSGDPAPPTVDVTGLWLGHLNDADSLVILVRTADGYVAARVAARM